MTAYDPNDPIRYDPYGYDLYRSGMRRIRDYRNSSSNQSYYKDETPLQDADYWLNNSPIDHRSAPSASQVAANTTLLAGLHSEMGKQNEILSEMLRTLISLNYTMISLQSHALELKQALDIGKIQRDIDNMLTDLKARANATI